MGEKSRVGRYERVGLLLNYITVPLSCDIPLTYKEILDFHADHVLL